MPTDVTADFLAAPDIKKFLGHRPLYITEPDRIQVVKQSAANPELLTIYGPDRLFWVNILEKDHENRFEAQLSTVSKPSAVLCYWLPWRKDGQVRIRLRVSRKYGSPLNATHMQADPAAANSSIVPGALTGAAITRTEFNPAGGGDPQLFFTGMMDGCSTWIAGDPAEPVVYHINRASHPVPAFGDAADSGDDEHKTDVFKFQSHAHKHKTIQMKSDFQTLQGLEAAKDKSKGVGVTPDKHKMHQYDASVQVKWRKQMKSAAGVGGDMKILKQYTSTFGRKIRGSWTFYAQDIYEYRLLDQYSNAIGAILYTAGKAQKKYP